MGEFRLNAVRSDTDEIVDFIDLREPIDSSKIVRNRDALKERVAVRLGGSVASLVEIQADSGSHLTPVDLPAYDQVHPVFGTFEPVLRLVVDE